MNRWTFVHMVRMVRTRVPSSHHGTHHGTQAKPLMPHAFLPSAYHVYHVYHGQSFKESRGRKPGVRQRCTKSLPIASSHGTQTARLRKRERLETKTVVG